MFGWLFRRKKRIEPYRMMDVISEALKSIDLEYSKNNNESRGNLNTTSIETIPTGFNSIDSLIGGFHSGELVIVGARPSMGKSSFLLNIMQNMALGKRAPVVIFSLQMNKETLAKRLLCSFGQLNCHLVSEGLLQETDWPLLCRAAGGLSDAPIYIDDTPDIWIDELRQRVMSFKRNFGIEAVFIDSLQLLKSVGQYLELSALSRSLKHLAKEAYVPIIASVELSRQTEMRDDHVPLLADLPRSVEWDADLVLLLYRAEYYNPKEENQGLADVIIAKNRNGPVGTSKLKFTRECVRFEDIDKVE
jgi:replicative DNA helicase